MARPGAGNPDPPDAGTRRPSCDPGTWLYAGSMPTPIRVPGPHGPIPALLAGDPARSRAGVVLGHGLGGTMQTQWPEAQLLAAAGFATLLPEAPHHGLRADGLLARMSSASAPEARACFLDLLETWAEEAGALVDHLAALGCNRFAAAGVSMGGHLALAVPGRDPRIEAVIAFNADPVWDDRPGSPHLDLGAWRGTSLLAITTDEDPVVPPGPLRAFTSLLNARFGTERAVSLTYPGGHLMEPRDWADAWARVQTWLDLRFSAPPGGPPP